MLEKMDHGKPLPFPFRVGAVAGLAKRQSFASVSAKQDWKRARVRVSAVFTDQIGLKDTM